MDIEDDKSFVVLFKDGDCRYYTDDEMNFDEFSFQEFMTRNYGKTW
jgi:hypothetical protein